MEFTQPNHTDQNAAQTARGGANPVEVIFLGVISLLFFASLYNLVYSKQITLVKLNPQGLGDRKSTRLNSSH